MQTLKHLEFLSFLNGDRWVSISFSHVLLNRIAEMIFLVITTINCYKLWKIVNVGTNL